MRNLPSVSLHGQAEGGGNVSIKPWPESGQGEEAQVMIEPHVVETRRDFSGQRTKF